MYYFLKLWIREKCTAAKENSPELHLRMFSLLKNIIEIPGILYFWKGRFYGVFWTGRIKLRLNAFHYIFPGLCGLRNIVYKYLIVNCLCREQSRSQVLFSYILWSFYNMNLCFLRVFPVHLISSLLSSMVYCHGVHIFSQYISLYRLVRHFMLSASVYWQFASLYWLYVIFISFLWGIL